MEQKCDEKEKNLSRKKNRKKGGQEEYASKHSGDMMSVQDPMVSLRKWKEMENIALISLGISGQLWSLR